MDKLTLLSGYAAVIYVDGTMGNDTTGNGTEALPYKTILKASQSVSVDNTMIYIAREGIYNEYSFNPIVNYNYKVTFSTITVTDSDKKVSLILNVASAAANNIMTKENIFIGFTIQRNPNSNLVMYAYFNDLATINLSFINCVFDKSPHSPTGFPIYTGHTASGATVIKMEYINCTFIPTTFSQSKTTTGQYRGDFIKCAIADSNLTSDTGNTLSATFDSEFLLTSSTAQVGVYNGTYAWTYVAKAPRNKENLLIGYADVIYVDGMVGNDTAGNGSEVSPYRTILKASQSVKFDDTMIYIAREGVYNEISLNEILNLNYKTTFSTVTITDSRKKVYFRFRTSSISAAMQSRIMNRENIFIGAIIQMEAGSSYMSFYNAATVYLSFINCVFDLTPLSPSNYVIILGSSNSGANVIKMDYVNCTFLPVSFTLSNSTTITRQGGNFVKCAIASPNLTATTGNVLSGIFDIDYQLLNSTSLVGVYEGAYAWNYDNALTIVRNDGKHKKYSNGLWVDVSTTLPTEQEFKTHGMSIAILRNVKRELTTQSDNMLNQGVLGSGKLFKTTINLDKYFDIKSIEIK